MLCHKLCPIYDCAVMSVPFISSAGVGRTGTFIGLDYLLDEAKQANGVSPYDCVELMRQRRPKMVQTEVSL